MVFPDRLELHLTEKSGNTRILGRANFGPAGLLLVDGQPVRDKRGLIKCGSDSQRLYISADLLFPEYGKVKRTSYSSIGKVNPKIEYERLVFFLPVDIGSHYREAAREGRIILIANHQKMDFYERTKEGREVHIGTINIDSEGYLMGPAGRYIKDGEPINIHSHRKIRISLNAAELVECFRLRDIPMHLSKGRKRGSVSYNQVKFNFNSGAGNAYLNDFMEGTIFMRVGYSDRLEIIRKKAEQTEILGIIRIDKDGFLLDAKGARYNPSKGPVRLGEYQSGNIARLAGAFKPDEGAETRERQAIASALIWKYRYLVDVFARKYVGQGASEDELVEAGMEGLRKASQKYDEMRGFTFRTYARRWIKSEMQATIRRKKKEIWGGEDRARLIGTLRREERRFNQREGYDPSDQELAERLGLTEKRVASLRRSAARRVFSLQAPKNGNEDFLWIDSIPDDSVINPEAEAIEREAQAKIEAALGSLDPRERYILEAHYGDEEMTLERIGEILGEAERGEALTRERIRQIEEQALNTVRENHPSLASYL